LSVIAVCKTEKTDSGLEATVILESEKKTAHFDTLNETWWIYGPKGASGHLDSDPDIYGYYAPSKGWCEAMLELLGHDLPYTPCLGLHSPPVTVLQRALEDSYGPARWSIYTAGRGLYSQVRLHSWTMKIRLTADSITKAVETYEKAWKKWSESDYGRQASAYESWVNGNRTDAMVSLAKMRSADVEMFLRQVSPEDKDQVIKFLIQKYVTLT
jgi:hypothetical protein